MRQAGCAALGSTGLVGALSNLQMLRGAVNIPSAMAAPGDFKALVCIFLFGGNDSNNLIIPRDTTGYQQYAQARQELTVPQSELLAIHPRNTDGREWALHPNVPEMHSLFNAGKLAFLCNVGTLVAPVTRAAYLSKSAALPPQLFSHNDQQVHWQTSRPDAVKRIGWAGRMADLLNAANENAQISMSISLNNNNVLQVGQTVMPYQISTSGPKGLSFHSNSRGQARRDAVMQILEQSYDHLFAQEHSNIALRADAAHDTVEAALASAPETTSGVWPEESRLAQQLQMVAKLISAHANLNQRRQTYFCSLGGWDTHGDQLEDHPYLLAELSACLQAFYSTMEELNLGDKVTTFTASDFGRTHTTNGDGSDHGWGGHHLIMGDAVNGGDFYGQMPNLAIEGPDDTKKGRWIPTVSVDEYSATLARWFGVPESDLSYVLPNLGRFATPDLGFMQAG